MEICNSEGDRNRASHKEQEGANVIYRHIHIGAVY